MATIFKRYITVIIDKILFPVFYMHYGSRIILFESHYVRDGNAGALYSYLRAKNIYDNYTFVWIVNSYSDGAIKNSKHNLFFSIRKRSFKKGFLNKMSATLYLIVFQSHLLKEVQ